MEMRGEVRRGYFVQGLPGVQFALPEAVERLREWTRPPALEGPVLSSVEAPVLSPVEGPVVLNACDPANLFGPAQDTSVVSRDVDKAPGDAGGEHDPARFTRIPSNYVVLLRGKPVLLLETGGQRATSLADLPPATLRQALKQAVTHIGTSMRRLTLSQWNGQPVLDSPAAPLLEELGFRREALVYIWD